MLEIKRAVYPSAEQWDIVVSGCRNAYKSYEKRDSYLVEYLDPNTESTVLYIDDELCGTLRTAPEDKLKMTDNPDGDLVGYTECEEFFIVGTEDKKLLQRLCNAQGGEPSHSKFLRQLPVILDIRAPLYWWKQMDKYQIGTVTNSESTMHTITKSEFDLDDFSMENTLDRRFTLDDYGDICNEYTLPVDTNDHAESTIRILNKLRDEYLALKSYRDNFKKLSRGEDLNDPYVRQGFAWKFFELSESDLEMYSDQNLVATSEVLMKRVWYAIIELLPESYMQTRTWSANYEVLRKIVKQRAGHPLRGEWEVFIDWIRENVPMAKELIFNEWEDEEA